MSIHDGHRQRMKRRFTEYGIDNFDDVNVLELLLFFSNARGDTNPTAHELLNRFGSLAGVFDASPEELKKVYGIGDTCALLIKLVPQVAKRYLISKSSFSDIINSSDAAGEYLIPRFYAAKDEMVYLLCLDSKNKVIGCKLIAEGSVNSAGVSVRKIVETALANNASSVILSHNHTSGIAIPSTDDRITTDNIRRALSAVDIVLADHIIVANDDYVSMADSGFFRDI